MFGRALGALLLFGSVLAYVVSPEWMSWAAFDAAPWLRWAGAGLGLAVVLAVHWVLRALGNNVSETVLTKDGQELVTHGPYRWVRHPLYTTGITLFVAMGMIAANWFLLAATMAAAVAIRCWIIPVEERALLARFGEGYARYRRTAGALMPRTRGLRVIGSVGLASLVAAWWVGSINPFSSSTGFSGANAILVLEDSDDDFKAPPFQDAVTKLGPNGEYVRLLTDLNMCQTVGAQRALSVDPLGRFFTVCESVGDTITAHQLATGEQLWRLKGGFRAAVSTSDGLTYALTSDGTIYGKDTLVVDQAGHIIKRKDVGGFDLVMDQDRNAIWLVGKTIKKCDRDLNLLMELDLIEWCGVSVDLDRDGSIWMAEREHPDVARSTNRVVRISSDGRVLRSVGLPFSPTCLRVDRSDGSVLITGGGAENSVTERFLNAIERRTGRLPTGDRIRGFLTRPQVWWETHKYNQEGVLLWKARTGGFSMDLDRSDGSVWVAGRRGLRHYSSDGVEIGHLKQACSDQEWVVVIPTGTVTEHDPASVGGSPLSSDGDSDPRSP